MRVLHLTRDYPPRANGGLSHAVGGLVRALHRGGTECSVISFDGWRPTQQGSAEMPLEVENCDGGRVLRVTESAQADTALARAAQESIDLLHVHHGMLWSFAETLRQQSDRPLATCFTVHLLQRELNRLRAVDQPTLSLTGQETAFAQADAIIAPSNSVFQSLREQSPTLANRLHRIGLGVDPAVRSNNEEDRVDGLVLYAGRFADVKGTGELFELIPRVLQHVPDAHFVIAGGNPESPSSERRWLKRWQQLASPAVQEKVDFVGWVTPERLAELHRQAALFICPSWYETFGLAALEAMAHGAAVVATTGGALPELIEDGETGLLAPPKDVDALVERVVGLLADRRLAKQLGNAAASVACNRYGWAEVAAASQRLYGHLCAPSSSLA